VITTTVRRWLHEPLLQFLLIGLLLFILDRAQNPVSDPQGKAGRIEVTEDDLRQLDVVWAAQWQRHPTPEEVRNLVAANAERFALPGRLSFHHLYFSLDRRGEQARDKAAQARQQLASVRAGSPAAACLADAFMFQDYYYADRTPEQVAGVFGAKFVRSLFELKPESWQGPIESGLGWHLVWVDSVVAGRAPAFEEIEGAVKSGEPLPEVSRVVFICTPQRGSFVAGRNIIANLVRRLLTLPFALTGMAADIARNPGAAASVGSLAVPSAVDNMSPRHHFIRALQEIPVAPSVTVNSIIAVEGDGPVEDWHGIGRAPTTAEAHCRKHNEPTRFVVVVILIREDTST